MKEYADFFVWLIIQNSFFIKIWINFEIKEWIVGNSGLELVDWFFIYFSLHNIYYTK